MVSPLLLKLQKHDQLSPDEQRVVEDLRSGVISFRPNDEIVREGDRPSFSSIVLNGWAGRVKTLPDGRRSILALHLSGDFVDLHSLLLRPMDHSVIALTACKIAKVPHDQLREVTERYPHLTRLLWLDTLVDAAIHREWMVGLGRRAAAAHLAHLLCELFLRCQAVSLTRGMVFDFPLSQPVLADVLGLSAVHVNRSLQELRQERLLTLEAGRLEILDWERLADRAAFDPAYLNMSIEPR